MSLYVYKFYIFRNELDVANELSEVYNVGTFVKIYHTRNVGDRFRLVVMGHRRVRILRQIIDDSEAPPGKLNLCFMLLEIKMIEQISS